MHHIRDGVFGSFLESDRYIVRHLIDNRVLKPGEELDDFRGKRVTFLQISRPPSIGKQGKVIIRDGNMTREVYASTLDARIVTIMEMPAHDDG